MPRCRCGQEKGSYKDLCTNPECDKRPVSALRTHSVISVKQHGFHEPCVLFVTWTPKPAVRWSVGRVEHPVVYTAG